MINHLSSRSFFMPSLFRLLFSAMSLCTFVALAQTTDKPFPVVKPDDIAWKDAGKGVKFAVISGDPSKAGPYVIRVIFPAWHHECAALPPRRPLHHGAARHMEGGHR
jgi:hypothetical protein